MPYIPALCVAFIAFALLYSYLTKNFNYWSKYGINGPKPYVLFGTTIYNFIGIKYKREKLWLRIYGRIYGTYNCSQPSLTIADPKLIQKILVSDFDTFANHSVDRINAITNQNLFACNGQKWKRLRPIMSSAFTLSKLRQMYPKISESSKQMINELLSNNNKRKGINIKLNIEKLVSNIICSCLLGADIPHNLMDEYVVNIKRVLNLKFLYEIGMTFLPISIMRFIDRIFGTKANVGNEYLISFGRDLMKRTKNCNKKTMNLIEMLLKIQRTQPIAHELKAPRFITEDETLGQIWFLFVSNTVMTASILSCLIHQLAVNDSIQQKLYNEFTENGISSDNDIDYDLLARLPYLDAVVAEALRMYTTVLKLSRNAVKDYRIESTGVLIKKGMRVEIPIYAMHMSDEYFPNADTFIPERFMGANKDNIIPYTYLPFGAGPRACVATIFGPMQIKICLAHLITKCRIYPTVDTSKQLEMAKSIENIEPGSVIIGVEERK